MLVNIFANGIAATYMEIGLHRVDGMKMNARLLRPAPEILVQYGMQIVVQYTSSRKVSQASIFKRRRQVQRLPGSCTPHGD
jgi:hypothetical protein